MSVISEKVVPPLGERKQLIYKCPRCGLEQILLEVQERITKARAILEDILNPGGLAWIGGVARNRIDAALKALEGK